MKKEGKKNSKKGSVKSGGKKDSKKSTLLIARDRDIALDFATKVYKLFDKMIKSVIFFGSGTQAKRESHDIDIVIIIDDVSIYWDDELISWYREELAKLVEKNPYVKPLHINTVKLSTWWQDLLRGDPVVINVLRYGEALIDFGGFFKPLRLLLKEGKIRATPEAVYSLLERTSLHFGRARSSVLSAVESLYWAMVDSAHALLISSGITPPSPEKIGDILVKVFVETDLLDKKYVKYFDEMQILAKAIVHGEKAVVRGKVLDELFEHAEDFVNEMAKLTEEVVESRK